jgi:hypothetical protein
MLSDKTLARWLTELRDRLARGELADLEPVELGYGTRHLPGEVAVRVLLNDLDDLNDPDGVAARDPVWHQERLDALEAELQQLRAQIG